MCNREDFTEGDFNRIILPDGELNPSLRYTLLNIFKTAKVVLCKSGRCATETMDSNLMALEQTNEENYDPERKETKNLDLGRRKKK